MRVVFVAALLVGLFALSAAAADPLKADQYKGLHKLSDAVVLVHEPDAKEAAGLISSAGLESKLLSDVFTIAVAKAVPSLTLLSTFRNDRPFIVISWYGTSNTIVFSLSVWRWTRLPESSDEVFVPVWSEEQLVVNPTRQSVREQLNDYATSFAADYLRANR